MRQRFCADGYNLRVERFEQYEVWAERAGRWELVAAFREFDVASAVARNYTHRMRLVLARYENGRKVHEDVIAELGSTRNSP